MKKVMNIIGWIILIPFIIIESIIKIIWAILYSITKPLWKKFLPCYTRAFMENYAFEWKGQLKLCSFLYHLWKD